MYINTNFVHQVGNQPRLLIIVLLFDGTAGRIRVYSGKNSLYDF